ncbi:MAG: hypothetical protein GY935_18295 [Gammaproteobacteria bacterium]|nr:hypothetical protein [Gammaproteobacteria bacterium]
MFINKQTLAIAAPVQIITKLDEGQLRAIPDEARAAIKKAATEGDIEQLQQLIMVLPDDLAELKTTLTSLTERFEFEALLKGLVDAPS